VDEINASILRLPQREAVLSGGNRFHVLAVRAERFLARFNITETQHQAATTAGFFWARPGWKLRLDSPCPGSPIIWPQARSAHHGGLSTVVRRSCMVPSLYQHLWLLAAYYPDERGEAMAAFVIVLLPTESVPAGLRHRHGLVTMTGELIGATLMPSMAPHWTDRYGQAMPLCWRAAGAGLVFLYSTRHKEGELRE